jgi:hypothetical protein
MNWRRVHEEGCDPKHWKQWRSGPYRIIWRDRVYEVTVPAAFQVCVQGVGGWEFLDHKKPLYRTLNAAKTACEKDKDPSYRPRRRKRRRER